MCKKELKIALIPLASKLRNEELTRKILSNFKVEFRDIYTYSFDIIDDVNLAKSLDFELGIALILTGGTEELIIELANLGKPIIYVPHEKMNSLPALMEAAPLIKEKSHVYILSLENVKERVKAIVKAYEVSRKLRGLKLGLIGGVSPWLVYSRISSENLIKKFGIKLIEISLDELLKLYEKSKVDLNLVNEVIRKSEKALVTRDEVSNALRIYVALKKLIKEKGFNFISLKCFDLIIKKKVTACLALSLLNTEGIVAGCEGDVPATLAMIVGYLISGKPTFIGNPAWVKDNKIMLAHCTIPLGIVSSYELLTHFESDLSVGIRGILKYSKEVTLLRFSRDLNKMRIIVGKPVLPLKFSAEHCRTQIIVQTKSKLSKLIEESLGNHYVLIMGNYVNELTYLGKILGMDLDVIV